MPEEAPPVTDGPTKALVAPIKPTPSGRAFVGTVVALGLYLGLRKLTTGWVLATFDSDERWWLSAEALTTVFTLQVIAAGFGAVLASAGRARGIGLGAAVGGLCGGLFLAAEIAAGASPTQLVLLLQPLLLAVAGAIAGAVGAWVWAAVPEFDMPAPLVKKRSSIELLNDTPSDTGRPTIWYRVLIGAMIIVAGMALAEKARGAAEKASGGMLKVSSRGQGKFMSWQIAALAVLAGGAFAGACTGAGIRHGIFTGVLGSLGVTTLGLVRGEYSQPEEYILKWLNLAGGAQDPAGLIGVAGGVLIAAFVGGWFGGQLFLPLAPLHMRTRRLHALD